MTRDEGTGMAIARLSESERIALQGYAARASWPAGFQIYERGTSADGVFIVTRGRVVLRSRVRAGRGFVPWVATPGETFGAEGLSQHGQYATDARADEETETLFLSSANLRAFVREQPNRALMVIGQIMAERTALLEKLRELLFAGSRPSRWSTGSLPRSADWRRTRASSRRMGASSCAARGTASFASSWERHASPSRSCSAD